MSAALWTRHITPRRALVLLALWLCIQGIFGWLGGELQKDGGLGPPDLIFFAEPHEIVARIDALGAAGRDLYLRTCFVDMVYPVVYSLLFASVFVLVGRRLDAEAGAAQIAPIFFAGALADWAENGCFLVLMRAWPEADRTLLSLAATFNQVKWGSLVLGLGVGLVALGVRAGRKMKVGG